MVKKLSTARVSDVMQVMDQWAPAWTAEEWDRVGLLAGDPAAEARLIWVALELNDAIVDQALAAGVSLLLTHHPPLFKPLHNLRTDNPATARLLMAVSGGLALFAAHTNLDSAPGGVNDALAQRLGLVDTRPLIAATDQGLAKLIVFVPPDQVDKVSAAVFAAGAGRIGAYRDCAFHAPGVGGFLAPAAGKPYLGKPGQRETVREERLETLLPLSAAGRVVAALKEAHPYEEPAFDLYPLKQPPAGFGLGRVGRLPKPQSGEKFIAAAAKELGAPAAQVSGPLPAKVERVAVIGGSGGDMLAQAAAAGAEVLITGEARYHAWEEANDLGLCLAVLGHYQTEAVIIEPWARRLSEMLESAGLFCEIAPWTEGACPWRQCPG
jgi:dinuclear metal center YbgI/SA1388 family protein